MYKRWLVLCFLLATTITVGCSDDEAPAEDAGRSDAAQDARDTASDAGETHSEDAADVAPDTADAGSDTDDSGPDTDPQTAAETGPAAASAYEQAALDFITTYCDAAFDCLHRSEDDDALANHFTRYDTAADCKADAATLVTLIDADRYQAEIEAGTIAFDAEKAQECQATLHDKVCDGRELDGVCAEALFGQFDAGESCTFAAQCADGTHCQFDDACTGTCTRFNSYSCGDRDCPSGTYCADGATSSCEPLNAAGEACETNRMCQPSLRCDETTDTCVLGFEDGESCTRNDDCLDGACNTQTDTCTAPGSLTEDDACDSHVDCEPSLACDNRSDTCIDNLAASGESCLGMFVRCESGRCQDVDTSTGQGTCGPLRQQGEACAVTMQCGLGLFCESSSGTCAAVRADGEVCSRALECASLRCLEDGTCGSGSSCGG